MASQTNKTAARFFAADFFTLTSRQVTSEGYLVAPGNVAAADNIQNYYAHEFGLDKTAGMDPLKLISLYRPPEEVFNEESLKSFEHKPITIEHPTGNVVNRDNWAKVAKGEMVNITRENNMMVATLIVKAKDAIDAIQAGKVQLSNGYSFECDWTPGETADRRKYDGVQRNIRGNHVALVNNARCGSACRIADSTPSTTGDSIMTTKQVVVDGIPFEVSDSAAAAINNLITARDTAKKELQAATDKLATMVDKKVHDDALTAKDADIAALKKDVLTPDQRDALVADWTKMIGDAKVLVPEIVTDGKTCLALRREVVTTVTAKDSKAKAAADAVLAGKTIDAADADTVRAVFNVLVATHSTADAGAQHNANDAAAVAAALAGKGVATAAADAMQLTGREAMLARQADAWKTK